MEIISKILNRIEIFCSKPRLRVLRTIYINLRLLPLKQAIKFPIFVYGRMKLFSLNGSVEFRDTKVKTGMLKFGTLDPFSIFDGSGFLSLTTKESKIVCYGPAHIDVNAKIRILGKGQIILGKYVRIRSGVRVICNGSYIKIGDYTGIPFDTNIINSSFHSIYNVNTREVARNTQPIDIGKCCWIGNSSAISAGTKLKDNTIVCAGSFVNRDFTILEEERQMISGRPAKLIKSGIKRIFNWENESQILQYFEEHPETDLFVLPDNMQDIVSDLTIDF